MIVLLSSADDQTADRVESELRSRTTRYRRLDLADFPQRVTASAHLEGVGRWTGDVHHADGSTFALEDVSSVYYRRSTNFSPDPGLNRADRRFAQAEARGGFGGVLADLPALWVNHPFRVADAEFKPAQLSSARRSGFNVPETVITNDGPDVRKFAASQNDQVVYKPLGGGFYRDAEDKLYVIYTTPISTGSLNDAEIGATAHAFQRFVDKAYDVRATAVGRRVFGVAIHSDTPEGHVDWRSDYNSLSYTEISVPRTIEQSIHDYLISFGLSYGAFDFSVDHSGRWWFLECNPNGQWGFVTETTGVPIASSIADLLTGDAR